MFSSGSATCYCLLQSPHLDSSPTLARCVCGMSVRLREIFGKQDQRFFSSYGALQTSITAMTSSGPVPRRRGLMGVLAELRRGARCRSDHCRDEERFG